MQGDPKGSRLLNALNLGRNAPGLKPDGLACLTPRGVPLNSEMVLAAVKVPGGTRCRVAVKKPDGAVESDYCCWATWRPAGAVAPPFGIEPVLPELPSKIFTLPGPPSQLYDLYLEVPSSKTGAGMTAFLSIEWPSGPITDLPPSAWTLIAPAIHPPADTALEFAMTYDSVREKAVLVCHDKSTWEYAAGVWTQRVLPGGGPDGEFLCYWPDIDRCVCLFNQPGQLAGTWHLYNGHTGSWQAVVATGSCPDFGSFSSSIFYHAARHSIIVVNGQGSMNHHMWELTESGGVFTWTNLNPLPAGVGDRWGAYDPVEDRLIIYGYNNSPQRLWAWDQYEWLPQPVIEPTQDAEFPCCYDPRPTREGLVVFAGKHLETGIDEQTTKMFNVSMNYWVTLYATQPMGQRRRAAMTYHAADQCLVVFGGEHLGATCADTLIG